MKRSLLILLVLFVFGFGTSSWGQCPEDPNDLGECDTLNVVPHEYAGLDSLPAFVTVKLLVTHDRAQPNDSITGFAIPLAYTHDGNPSKYCSLTSYWNNTKLFPSGLRVRSIFRHLGTAPADSNRMMSLSEPEEDLEWDAFILNLDGTSHFWFSAFPMTQGLGWWEGDRVLLATMTFRVEDTMTICIDTTVWPPTTKLKFSAYYGETFDPRHNLPICFKVDTADAGVREIQGSEDSRPSEFLLSQNYPNPFNPATNFQFSLSKFVHVKIDIFNIVGQKVRTLVDEEMRPGVYVADWDGEDGNGNFVSSGIYFYRMQAGDFSDMKKMLLLK